MRYLLLLLLVVGSVNLINAQNDGDGKIPDAMQLSGADFEFSEETHDFGEFYEGKTVKVTFEFKNIGDQELNIYKVQSGCSCIDIEWSMEPIKPGDGGQITVYYNSTDRVGEFYKSIEVLSDAKTTTKIIRIKGLVKEDFFKD